jgi:hypothetical protein
MDARQPQPGGGLHGRYYARDWSFGSYFEAEVAAGMAAFIPRLNPDRDLFLVARRGQPYARFYHP